MNTQDVQARMLAAELRETRDALANVLKEVRVIRDASERHAANLNATRRELAELRGKGHNSDTPDAVTRLVQHIKHKPPVARFEKAVQGARIFDRGREMLNGRIQHVTIAKDANGSLIELPCSYDLAHRFLRMTAPNRRLHWRGKRAAYGSMLALCLRLHMIERKGRRHVWAERFGQFQRLDWLTQFKPPHRVR